MSRGVVAAGNPVTAEAGADILRAGGNAVDAGIAAVAASLVAEPLLTGLGAGGYMLVAPPAGEPALLDFFVGAPGLGAASGRRAELLPIPVSFEETVQVFHAGPASCGAYGVPAGLAQASGRFGALPLADALAPAVDLARRGVEVAATQAYVVTLLEPVVTSTPEAARLFAPGGRLLRTGDVYRDPDLASALERLGSDGAEPFYRGDIAQAVADWVAPLGSLLTAEDLRAYEVIAREPVRTSYRGRTVLTNPPPSAGGILIALALALLQRRSAEPSPADLVSVMEAVQRERTDEFLEGLAQDEFATSFLGSRLGSTTHVSVLDEDGWACSVTCSNGVGSGVVVPGTGLHLNNMMGEEDLNPLGFFRHPPGRRMPSMMAPTVVVGTGGPEIVLGSAGSNRIRSAILQTISNVLDHGMTAGPAVGAPRLHWEDGVVYAEPGADTSDLEAAGAVVSRFREANLFFGGVQAVERDVASGSLSGGGDPRRGGGVAVVE